MKASHIANWHPKQGNVWELSGLFEGDIMAVDGIRKNALLDKRSRWKDAIIPYQIEKDDFGKFYLLDVVDIYPQEDKINY